MYRCTYVKRYLHAMYVCRMRVPFYLSGIDISFPSISTSNLYDSYSYVLSVMTCNYFHVSVSRHGLRFITRDSLLSKLHTKRSLNSTRSNTISHENEAVCCRPPANRLHWQALNLPKPRGCRARYMATRPQRADACLLIWCAMAAAAIMVVRTIIARGEKMISCLFGVGGGCHFVSRLTWPHTRLHTGSYFFQ